MKNTKNLRLPFLMGLLLIMQPMILKAETLHKSITCTCSGCCSNGATNSETDNYQSTDGGVTWTITSYTITGCDGQSHTYNNDGTMRSNNGTIPNATTTTFTCNDTVTNISIGNDTVTRYAAPWSIKGYVNGLAGLTEVYSLDCDSNGNVTLTTYPAPKISLLGGWKSAPTAVISGLSIISTKEGLSASFNLLTGTTISFQLFDILGKAINNSSYSFDLTQGQHQVQLPENVPAGAYLLRATADGDIKTVKIILGN